tara:strand:+ start:709 stop:1173 length:465 start_codon:yes stop_codon:yes gene_type:complete
MENKSSKRILLDMKLLQEMNIEHEIIDLNSLTCIIKGPSDTIYENGRWKVSITFPKNYPFKSPSIGFLDKIYHPNVDYSSGSICLNVLNEEWQPIYTIKHIIETFLPQLLTYPNPDDPLNIEAAKLYNENRIQFERQVKMVIFQNKKEGLSKKV